MLFLSILLLTTEVWGNAPLPGNEFTKLIFQDEFNTLDTKTWKHDITAGGGGNWEFQYYFNNRSSSFVKDGHLYIKPVLTTEVLGISDRELVNSATLDLWGRASDLTCTANADYGCLRVSNGNNIINPIMSSKLMTRNFSFKYGQVRTRVKLPKGDWIWPAMWLMPTYAAYGAWPASGEIDFIEARGNANYHTKGVDTVGSTLHWGPNFHLNNYSLTDRSLKMPPGHDFSQEFREYVLEWTEDHIRTWVDNQLILNVDFKHQSLWDQGQLRSKPTNNPWQGGAKNAPFDQEFHLIMNVAVGGTGFFPDETPSGQKDLRKPWSNKSGTAAKDFFLRKNEWYPTWKDQNNSDLQSALVVDYIRVYARE